MHRYLSALILGMLLPLCSWAEDSVATTKATLTRQANAWDKAIAAKDRAVIESNMADDFRHIGGDGETSEKTSFVADLMDAQLTIDPYTVEDLDIRLLGDVALLSGTTRMTGKYGDKPFRSHYRYIDIYVRRDGVWKVVNVQITRLPE